MRQATRRQTNTSCRTRRTTRLWRHQHSTVAPFAVERPGDAGIRDPAGLAIPSRIVYGSRLGASAVL